MTHLLDSTGLVSLIWPLTVCAAAWGITAWALHQRDTVSEAVDGLLSPHQTADAAADGGNWTRNKQCMPLPDGNSRHRIGQQT